jgi:hypothetical protein
MTVEEMKDADVRTVDPESLIDITKMHIDKSMSGQERMKEFIRQGGNPYCYRVGATIVKNVYAGTGATLQERLKQFIMAK